MTWVRYIFEETLTYHIASSDTANPLDLFVAMAVQFSH